MGSLNPVTYTLDCFYDCCYHLLIIIIILTLTSTLIYNTNSCAGHLLVLSDCVRIVDYKNCFPCSLIRRLHICALQVNVDGCVECLVSKQLLFHSLPQILILHMKRFHLGQQITKNNRHINFPIDLDLAPFCTKRCQVSAIILA